MTLKQTFAPPAIAVAIVMLARAAAAQEGFPLDGTWRGAYGPVDEAAVPIVLVMKWDGKRINGMIDPGPDSVPFDRAVLEPADWKVRIEARTPAGERIRIEGTLEDIGAPNRRIEGTWTQNGVAYDFEIVRQ
jgi:hypothetical protein